MEIGLFQLENIFNARTQFTFLDLREKSSLDLGPELSKIVALATPVTSENIEGHLNRIQIAKEYPVILLCEDGRESSKVARRLEASGFVNVYVVARGLLGLESEL